MLFEPVRKFLFIATLFISVAAAAQITAPGANTVRYTSYGNQLPADPVFIFCNSSGQQKGSLVAGDVSSVGKSNFTWYKWDDVTNSFGEAILNETAVAASTLANLDEGGYRVSVSGAADTVMTAWIFIDKPLSAASLQNRTCDYVALHGLAAADTFFYSNPSNGIQSRLPNGVRFLWSSSPSSTIPFPDLAINPQTFDPPLTDVRYNLQVTDSFGCVNNSWFDYTSIHVKADFTLNPEKGEAPLEVSFTDKSVRAAKYLWEFGDDSTSTLSDPDRHIYYKPGEYSVKLTVESDLHCIDSMTYKAKVVVEPSDLDIPNVFSPDGDGLNDYFVPESPSMRFITMIVYSRSGRKMYSFTGEGESLREWKGWDGNINGSSIKASPGVYYYIVRAYGWDDITYDSKEYRGFVYLYR